MGRDGKRTIQPDPLVAPMIRTMFERYASGNYNLKQIATLARADGLAFRKTQNPVPVSSGRDPGIGGLQASSCTPGDTITSAHLRTRSWEEGTIANRATKTRSQSIRFVRQHFRAPLCRASRHENSWKWRVIRKLGGRPVTYVDQTPKPCCSRFAPHRASAYFNCSGE